MVDRLPASCDQIAVSGNDLSLRSEKVAVQPIDGLVAWIVAVFLTPTSGDARQGEHRLQVFALGHAHWTAGFFDGQLDAVMGEDLHHRRYRRPAAEVDHRARPIE